MSIDLTFTKEPEWISKRQKCWDGIYDLVAEDSTKKELDWTKEYFFTGTGSIHKLHPESRMLYFPRIDFDGLSYVFRNLIDSDELSDKHFSRLEARFTTNLDYWPCLRGEDKKQLFLSVYGKTYDPDRTFPFLIGDEQHNRKLQYSVNGLLARIITRILRAYGSEEAEDKYWFDKEIVEYYISLFPLQNDDLYSTNVPHESRNKSVDGVSLKSFSSQTEKLFRAVRHRKRQKKDSKYYDLIDKAFLQVEECVTNLDSEFNNIKQLWKNAEHEKPQKRKRFPG